MGSLSDYFGPKEKRQSSEEYQRDRYNTMMQCDCGMWDGKTKMCLGWVVKTDGLHACSRCNPMFGDTRLKLPEDNMAEVIKSTADWSAVIRGLPTHAGKGGGTVAVVAKEVVNEVQ